MTKKLTLTDTPSWATVLLETKLMQACRKAGDAIGTKRAEKARARAIAVCEQELVVLKKTEAKVEKKTEAKVEKKTEVKVEKKTEAKVEKKTKPKGKPKPKKKK